MFRIAKILCSCVLFCLYFSNSSFGQSIILQSTTSTANSGLYDYLLPHFTNLTGITVHVVAVGTGQALKNAENGDGDVVLVHSKADEENFVSRGFGVERFDVMYNDFVIIGPASDPANISSSNSIISALSKIFDAQTTFISRGDQSGTHKKETQLWKAAKLKPTDFSGDWYLETGSGMGAAINIAVGKGAYILSDRATWINYQNKQNFEILFEGDEDLNNQYGIILVNPNIHPHTKKELGQQFINWILSSNGQTLIRNYKVNGHQLFFPNFNLTKE